MLTVRWWGILVAFFGFTSVALGAFGAHALRSKLALLEEGSKRLEWWHTGVEYQMFHTLALFGLLLLYKQETQLLLQLSALAFILGILLFSGSLYTMTITGLRYLGAVTPLGGLAFLIGWALLTAAFFRS
ncbi:MAG: DUF423 domain-containing protein [Myxococcales bacterium]|nr:MAG: DUF423 domain-containing protein [Myxococcales bacterium]